MHPNAYQKETIATHFDRMAKTYGVVNYLCSFGFAEYWRHSCIKQLPVTRIQGTGADLMSGGGELWRSIAIKATEDCSITAVDLSTTMVKRANYNKHQHDFTIHLTTADALNPVLFETHSLDFIVSSFGLKTFSAEQQRQLAGNIARWLKPGGFFSFVEIATPANPILKFFYILYLKHVVAFFGWLFMGNNDSYGTLGGYTLRFGQGDPFLQALQKEGLQVTKKELFFGCAICFWGTRIG